MGKTFLRLQVSHAARLTGLGRVLLLLLGGASLSTCGPGHGEDCLTSTGPVVTERRELPAGLLSVYANDNVDLILVQEATATAAPYAEVRTGKNLIADIETRVEGNQLQLSNTARCNWARSYDTPREVTLHVPAIKNVFLHGTGNVSTAGQFRQDTIFFHLTGAGDMNLDVQSNYLWMDLYELGDETVRGSADQLILTQGGNGRFFGQDLRTRVSYLHTNRDSNGDTYLQVTGFLGASIRGNGTVYYSGHPGGTDIQVFGHGQAQPVP